MLNFFKKKTFIAVLFFSFLASGALATPKPAYIWNELGDGFLYSTFAFSNEEKERTEIHAFRIDPAKFNFKVLLAPDKGDGSDVVALAKKNKAVLAINGGFFTPEHKSIGLIVNDGKIISPLHKTSWWSVFSIRGGKAFVEKLSDFQTSPDVQVAIQAGPRLIVDGNIPKLKESVAARSAIGITKNGDIIIAITSGRGISMSELARRMTRSPWEGGLNCVEAMALDGGSSSQLYAKIKKFELNLPGIVQITNALAVTQK